jgi:hypothetical protein
MVVLHSPVKEMAILLSLVNCIRIAITLFSDLRLEKNLPPQLLAQLSSLSLSSLSPPPDDVDVNVDVNILPPPPPCMMVVVVVIPVFLPAAGQRQCRILPPPPPHIIVFVPVFLPPRRSTSCVDVNVASYHPHRHAQSSLLSSSPSVSPPPFDVVR